MVFFAQAHASKMASQLQEAIYLFEMKGEVDDAIRLLEKISRQGDDDDKEAAFFYLGKIYDMASNKAQANHFYARSQAITQTTSKAYWLAGRDAATSFSPERLLKKIIPLRSPIRKFFNGKNANILYENGHIAKLEGGLVIEIASKLNEGDILLHIDSDGMWYHNSTRDTLFFKSHISPKQQLSFNIKDITQFVAVNTHAFAMTDRDIYILDRKGSFAKGNNNYGSCQLQKDMFGNDFFIVNCPDNALHFISTDSLKESFTIAQYDIIQQTFIFNGYIYLISGNVLFCYAPQNNKTPLWKANVGNIETLQSFENNIITLEASGKVTLYDRLTGTILSSIRVNASSLYPLAQGTLGLFSSEGAVITVDTLLRPLWNFNFAKAPLTRPVGKSKYIYIPFEDKKVYAIDAHYYGQRPLYSSKLASKAILKARQEDWDNIPPVLDTIIKNEPGNAEAHFLKALYLEQKNAPEKERQKTWAEAVRLSIGSPQIANTILSNFSKVIGASFASPLNISPKTMYPQFLGAKKSLYTIDPATEQLICINVENGEQRWNKYIGKTGKSPVIESDENAIFISSGYQMNVYDINKDAFNKPLQLPGKVFHFTLTSDFIYVSTWNGFLIKISRSSYNIVWSRKVYSMPFHVVKFPKYLQLCNLDGELLRISDDTGFSIDKFINKVQVNISSMEGIDSTLVLVSSTNKMFLQNTKRKDFSPIQVLMEYPIISAQVFRDQNENKIILSLADQSILLYSSIGTPLWKYQGKKSIFSKPFIYDGQAWIDQGNEIIALSLKDGKVVKTFNTPGGAGTPFILNHTLFSASPKRILYGFPL
jgi:outer membrane protein assembly factor BamB